MLASLLARTIAPFMGAVDVPEVVSDLIELGGDDYRASAIVGRYGAAFGCLQAAIVDGRLDHMGIDAPAIVLATLDAQRIRWLSARNKRLHADATHRGPELLPFRNPTIRVTYRGFRGITGRHEATGERWAGIPGLTFNGSPGPAPDNYRELARHDRLLRAIARELRQDRHRSTRGAKARRLFVSGQYAPGGAYCMK